MPITIIGGTSGSGKTSLARFLATSEPRGVHIETDRFFRFIAQRLDPSLPQAERQNTTVVRAYVAAALEYSNGGYAVYVDGVIGPWLLPLITSMAANIRYVLLHAPLHVVLARARARSSQPSATLDIVTRMHEQFASVPRAFRRHIIHTHDKSVDLVANEYTRRVKNDDAYKITNPNDYLS